MLSETKKITLTSYILSAIVIVPLIFLPTTIDVFNIPKEILLFSISVGAVFNSIINSKSTNNNLISWLFPTVLLGIIITSFFTDTSISRLLFGVSGRANGLIYYFGVFSLAFLAARATNLDSIKFQRNFILALHLVLFINLTYCLIQYAGLDPISWNNRYNRIIGTVGNPNFAASILATTAVFYFILCIRNMRVKRFWFGFLFLLSTFLSYETDSIQGPILVFLAIGTFLLFKLLRVWKPGGLVLLGISLLTLPMVIMGLLGKGPLGPYIFERTFFLRSQYWKIAVDSMRDSWVFGLGPDSYLEAFHKYRTPDLVQEYGLGLRSDAAHNILLNFGTNFGLLNMALLLFLTIYITIHAIKAILLDCNIASQVASLIWIVLFVGSQISIEQIGLSSIQWIVGGFLLNKSFYSTNLTNTHERKSKSENTNQLKQSSREGIIKSFSGELTFLAILISAILLRPILQEEVNLRTLILSKSKMSLSEQDQSLEYSKYSFYSKLEFPRAIGLFNMYVSSNNIVAAENLLENIVQKDRQSVEALLQLAFVKNALYKYSEEIKLREEILLLSPLHVANKAYLAVAYQQVGKLKEARQLASSIKNQNFEFLLSADELKLVDKVLDGDQ